DGVDPGAGHGEHERPGREGPAAGPVADVARQCGLGVGPGGYQVHAVIATVFEARAQHGPDRGDAVVLVRRRGHGQPGVVGEQRHHAVDVGRDVRIGETPGEGPLLVRPRPRRPAGPGSLTVLV